MLNMSPQRRSFLGTLTSLCFVGSVLTGSPADAFSSSNTISPLSPPTPPSKLFREELKSTSSGVNTVAYRTIALPLAGFATNVPVACWYPVDEESLLLPLSPSSASHSSSTKASAGTAAKAAQYTYRISVRRIGELLARWDFIPEFVTRKFTFVPGSSTAAASSASITNTAFVDGTNIPIPKYRKVVVLAHGFLGSRLDLSHIAEDLAAKGFVCVCPEYPESLEASYPRQEGLDRKAINDRLVRYVKETFEPTSYSAIGHSMGCGAVLQMGDESWSRVLMGIGRAPGLPGSVDTSKSKYPMGPVGGRLLFVSSTNDGAVKFGGGISVPEGYTMLQESDLGSSLPSSSSSTMRVLPDRAALVFDRQNGPNHISFLSENVNEAMISFLAPLLPVAAAFDIPVLDFDKYVTSRDSVPTAAILKPLISDFLLAGTSATVTPSPQP